MDVALSLGLWALAASPVALLFALVMGGIRTSRAATVVLGWVLSIGALAFRAPIEVLLPAIGKGVWLGTWILLVVWPALLLYRLASGAGLERIGRIFATILTRRRENLLVLAWIFPSFIQGIAGFGTPIAIVAPLLLAMGWSPTRAVVYPLIGYHWAVTFGSMGSSFYMAALTTNLSTDGQLAFALTASGLLAVQSVVAGALVLVLDGGWDGLREGWRVLLVAGIPMALTLVATAMVVPAVASLAAGSMGLICTAGYVAVQRRSASAPVVVAGAAGDHRPTADGAAEAPAVVRGPIALLSPYIYLLATALPVFLWPRSRAFVQDVAQLALDFPSTRTGLGWVNAPVEAYTPIALFGHPGTYILLACGLGYVTYRRAGLWGQGRTRQMITSWARSLPQASISVVLLTCVATILTDSGMVSVLAQGTAEVTGAAFPAISPVVGAVGSFVTGSTTSSNALFSVLQSDVAGLIDRPVHVMLAAQTAGANIGNALAPVVILIGLSAVDGGDDVGRVIRMCWLPSVVLFVVVIAGTFAALSL